MKFIKPIPSLFLLTMFAAIIAKCSLSYGAVSRDYILLNGVGNDSTAKIISDLFGIQSDKNIAVGFGTIISLLNGAPNSFIAKINSLLALSLKYNLPVQIKLEVEIWWGYRKDLWNWWDPTQSGYNPENKNNVEWTSWNPDSAVKICWLNWGRQIRMLPCPNIMSPAYKTAWKTELPKAVTAIKTWYDSLPDDKKYLFAGIVIGWESSIGANVFHIPNGNSYLTQPEANDPAIKRDMNNLPSRGLQTIGYAAVKTANIKTSGTLTGADQAEAVRRHLEDMSKTVYDLGIPRELIFTHCGGWAPGEDLYSAAVNQYSCPGWSFYKYAADPSLDTTAMRALAASNAPYWGVVEWLLQGTKTQADWVSALTKSLAGKSRVVSIYNWSSIAENTNALNAIKQVNKSSVMTSVLSPPSSGTANRLPGHALTWKAGAGNSKTVSYTIAEAARVTIRIYTLEGRPVATLTDGYQQPGTYRIPVSAQALPRGLFILNFKAGGINSSKRVHFLSR